MAVYVSANSLSSYGIRVRSLKLSTLVTHSLTTYCCFVELIDVALACEGVISKLVDAITVAVIDAEKRVDGSWVEILRLKFGQDIMAEIWLIFFRLNLCSDFLHMFNIL